MVIEFIKDTEDIRPNRSKILKKGLVLSCTDELGKQYIKAKYAVEKGSKPADLRPIKEFENEEK